MLNETMKAITARENLSMEQAEQVMEEIMTGRATQAQIGCILTALHMKGETIEEISGFAKVMREKASRIYPDVEMIVDTCGTGGDRLHTFNISTTVAFVVAGCGVAVAKHGNRSVSSKSGSADVLEALGVNINLSPEMVKKCIETTGIGFMFAPGFHSAMKHAIGARREIGIRTVFNILGPLTNPASANAQVLGVYEKGLTQALAEVLNNLGTKHALVVHGHDGLDEISTTTETTVSELKNGDVTTYTISPEQFGITRTTIENLRGGDAQANAKITEDILKGEKGPFRDIVLINAAAALMTAGKAEDITDGLVLAAESIDSGNALKKLEQLREFSASAIGTSD
jgi:anthranilate phosphoribosyltransferase